MDIPCTRCGEPWSIDEVLHGQNQAFQRKGCCVSRCPTCWKCVKVKMPTEARRLLNSIAHVAPMFGNDLDGFAAFLDDLAVKPWEVRE